jgi:hypothetical protein
VSMWGMMVLVKPLKQCFERLHDAFCHLRLGLRP